MEGKASPEQILLKLHAFSVWWASKLELKALLLELNNFLSMRLIKIFRFLSSFKMTLYSRLFAQLWVESLANSVQQLIDLSKVTKKSNFN